MITAAGSATVFTVSRLYETIASNRIVDMSRGSEAYRDVAIPVTPVYSGDMTQQYIRLPLYTTNSELFIAAAAILLGRCFLAVLL